MSENIMYKNIADKMKQANEDKAKIKEIIKDIKEIYYFKPLLDYITNLQQENESNINRIHELEQEIDSEYIQKEDYKSRCEEAVEYIKVRVFDEVSIAPFDDDFNCKENLLNILNGSDEK